MSCVDGSRVASDDLMFWRLVGCSLVSGLLMRPSRDRWPWWCPRTWSHSALQAFAAFDIRRGVRAPGLTGAPSLLIVLTTSLSW